MKTVTALVKDKDTCVYCNKEYERVPNIDIFSEQHGIFKKQMVSTLIKAKIS